MESAISVMVENANPRSKWLAVRSLADASGYDSAAVAQRATSKLTLRDTSSAPRPRTRVLTHAARDVYTGGSPGLRTRLARFTHAARRANSNGALWLFACTFGVPGILELCALIAKPACDKRQRLGSRTKLLTDMIVVS